MTNFYEKSLRYNVKKRIRVYRLIQKKEKKSLREIGSIKKLNIIINKMPQFFVHFCLYWRANCKEDLLNLESQSLATRYEVYLVKSKNIWLIGK